jgi:hypothetical protein
VPAEIGHVAIINLGSADILESNGIAWPNPSMWRRPIGTFVPTYHPDDGADLHLHSPRRRTAQTQVKSVLAGTPFQQNVMMPTVTQPFRPSALQYIDQNDTGSGQINWQDPFNADSTGFDWVGSLTCGASNDVLAGKNLWANTMRSANRYSGTDTSMPDLFSTQMPESMQISEDGMEKDRLSPKVPTNTPTGPVLPDDYNCGAFMMSTLPMHSSTIPADLATSLTHSLLNQPHPLPIQQHNMVLSTPDVRSKENRYLCVGNSNPSTTNCTPLTEHIETRKLTQALFAPGPLGTNLSLTNPIPLSNTSSTVQENNDSPVSGSLAVYSNAASRTGSAADFCQDINSLNAGPTSLPLGESLINSHNLSVGSNAGLKRIRSYTPNSNKLIDNEDEPRRISPRERLLHAFVEDVAEE